MRSCTTIVVVTSALLIASVASQIVSPFATHDCNGETVYTGDHACNNILTTCCAFSGECCAGGCCPELATCIFKGTSHEACCSLSDSTLCGSVQPQSSKTCPNPAGPSVPCSGVGSTWYCAHGCTCDVSRDYGCNCFGGSCSDSSGGASSSAAAPTSTYVPSAVSSSFDNSASSTTAVVVSPNGAVPTSVGSVQTTSAVFGGGTSTTASVAAAATTTKASDGTLKMQTARTLIVGILLLGIVVVF